MLKRENRRKFSVQILFLMRVIFVHPSKKKEVKNMERQTAAILVELEDQLEEDGVPEETVSDFIDRIEQEIEDPIQTPVNGEESKVGN